MKSRSITAMGALHPILFFAAMYVVVLFLSIFICSTIFNSINQPEANFSVDTKGQYLTKSTTLPMQVSSAVVVR